MINKRSMGLCSRLWCALMIGASWCGAVSLDFAVSADLSALASPSVRFAADRQGNIVLVGQALSCTLPTVRPVATCGPVWLGKLDPSGQKLLFATYLGGQNLAGLATDAADNIVVFGSTQQDNLLTVNALQPARRGGSDFYIVKLAGDGSGVIYATYLGGTSYDDAAALAVDDQGAAYLLGSTFSTDFPTTAQSLRRPPGGGTVSVIAKLAADGQSLAYASYVPFIYGSRNISVDALGAVVLVSDSFSLLKGPEIWKLAPDGSMLQRTLLPDRAFNSGTVFPRAAGGFALAGSVVNGFLPVTSDALQSFSGPSPYVRVEAGQAVRVALPAHQLYGFAVDPQDRNRVFAATDGGLFMSEDNGWTWRLLRSGACFSIEVDPFDSHRLYLGVGTNPLPYRSIDGGASWQALDTGPPSGSKISSISADPNLPGLLYATDGSLLRSTNGGDSWDVRSIGPSEPNMSPSASLFTRLLNVRVDPTRPGWAYVTGFSSCIGFCPVSSPILQTKDAGASWTVVLTLTPRPPYVYSSLDSPARAFTDPATGDLFVSHDGQLLAYRNGNFEAPETLDPGSVSTLAFDPEKPGRIYAELTDPVSLIRSEDAGGTWTTVAPLDSAAGTLAIGAGGVLHVGQAATTEDAYFFVLDATGGIQYGTYLGGGATHVKATVSRGGRVFLGGSTNAGLTTAKASQPGFGGGRTDGFVAAFDESGTLLWSTYLGSNGDDSVDWILPLPDGSVVVVGTTNSADFPGLMPSALGAGRNFIARLRP